jgi:hypothetical protein
MTAYDVKRFHSRRSVKKYRFFFFNTQVMV